MATYLLNKGLRLDQVQLLLGHTNPRTTEIYAKTSLEMVKGDFDRIMQE
ncbi:MAG: tyrosine-type recombinase/integrase [archaeon]